MAAYGDGDAYSDAPAAKRRRSEDREGSLDPHRAPPSPVLHVRGLRETATQDDILEALRTFGSIAYVMMLPRKRQALVELEDIKVAAAVVKFCQSNTIFVSGQPAFFNFSTSTTIKRPSVEQGPGTSAGAENKVLLFTIQNPKYPITVDVLHTICSPSGDVVRIVVFKKNGVQAMVEFDCSETAKRARQSLNGCDIYSGCCTLKIEYAKPDRLNVYKNDSESWDYTNPNPGGGGNVQSPNRTLLGERPPPSPRQGPAGGGGPSKYPGEPPSSRGGRLPDEYDDRYDDGYGRRGPGRGSGRYGEDFDDFHSGPRGRPGYNGPPDYPRAEDDYGGPRSFDKPDYEGRFGGAMGRSPMSRGPMSHPGSSPMSPDGMQQGSVLMVYGMNMEKFNCDRLFNLLCLYGNVIRIKFLKTKEGVAMVQMADGVSVNKAVSNLNVVHAFGSKISLGYSKQPYLQDVVNPHSLSDGSSSFKDYTGTRNNRFSNPEAAAKNRIAIPAKVLHFFNTPAKISEDELIKIFESSGARAPLRVKQFPTKSERGSTGLLEWESTTDAVEALILTNHVEIPNPAGKIPYVFKLCFSSSPIMERGGQ